MQNQTNINVLNLLNTRPEIIARFLYPDNQAADVVNNLITNQEFREAVSNYLKEQIQPLIDKALELPENTIFAERDGEPAKTITELKNQIRGINREDTSPESNLIALRGLLLRAEEIKQLHDLHQTNTKAQDKKQPRRFMNHQHRVGPQNLSKTAGRNIEHKKTIIERMAKILSQNPSMSPIKLVETFKRQMNNLSLGSENALFNLPEETKQKLNKVTIMSLFTHMKEFQNKKGNINEIGMDSNSHIIYGSSFENSNDKKEARKHKEKFNEQLDNALGLNLNMGHSRF
jgi:hypothetical protein